MAFKSTKSDTHTIERKNTKLKKPTLYRVSLLNDDSTTMDFVVAILESVFRKSPSEAVRIMLKVHKEGKGLCGVFTKEIGEAKCQAVKLRAQASGYPLQCLMEPE